MRISDWSSDVCSSDLAKPEHHRQHHAHVALPFSSRSPTSLWHRRQRASAEAMIGNERIVATLLAEARYWPMTRNKTDVVTERKQALPNRTDQIVVIDARKIAATDTAGKDQEIGRAACREKEYQYVLIL